MNNIRIKTLDELANYINEADEWPTDVEDIIEANGWVSDTGKQWGVCHNDREAVILDDEGNAEVVTYHNPMNAKLKNKMTGEVIDVTSTNNHPDCSYGQSVWVDEQGQAYCIVGMPNPIYDIIEMDITNREELGKFIRLSRTSQGITVRGMAERCGLSPSTIQNLENGAFSPRLEIIVNILNELGLKLTVK